MTIKEDLQQIAKKATAHEEKKDWQSQIKVLKGGWVAVDLLDHDVRNSWKHDICPWSKKDGKPHKCGGVMNGKAYICDHFVQVGDNQAVDNVHCCYPAVNPV
jgi:hypothetical protein